MTLQEITLRDAAHVIDEHCDSAVSQDGQGWNKFDTDFMSSLLEQPSWTEKQKRVVYQKLCKYEGQLEDYGYSLDQIKDIPEQSEEENDVSEVKFYTEKGNMYVSFDYDEELEDKIKEQFIRNPGREEWWTKYVDDELYGWIEDFKNDWSDYDVICEFNDESVGQDDEQESVDSDVVVTKEDGDVFIDLEYGCENFEEIKDDVLKVVGCQFDGDTKQWVFGGDEYYLLDMLEPYQDQVKVTFDIEKRETEDFEEPEGFDGELYPFQKDTCSFMVKNKKVLVADQMGLGKTVSSLASVEHEESYPLLVVCPSSVKYNWEKEVNGFVPSRDVYVLEGMDDEVEPGHEIYIVNYYIFSEYVDDLIDNIEFDSLILDEVHRCKNSDTKRTQATKKLISTQSLDFIFGLSGTPFPNHPKELSQPLKILNRLSYFGGWKNYVTTYCGARYVNRLYGSFWEYEDDPKKLNNLDELSEKLREKVMVRHTKGEVIDDLPDKIRSFVPVDIDYSDYLEKEKEILETIQEKHRKKIDKLEQELRSLDPSSDEWHKKKDRLDNLKEHGPAEQLSLVNQLRNYLSGKKINQISKWVQDYCEHGEELIIFGHHKEAIEKIYDEFEDVAVKLTGNTSNEQREKNVEQFQNDEDTLLFIANIQAASEGITLTEADNVAFIEFSWVPSHIQQAEARAYARLNDLHGINSYFFYAEETIDESMMELLDNKQHMFDEVIDEDTEPDGFIQTDQMEEKGLEYVLENMKGRHE